MIDAVLRHPEGSPKVSELADQFGYSRFYLTRLFHLKTGEGLCSFLRRLRMERAAYMLRTSDHSIQTISEACGYRSSEAFSRAFREAHGCLPSNFPAESEWKIACHSDLHWIPTWTAPVRPRAWEETMQYLPKRYALTWTSVGNYSKLDGTWESFVDRFERFFPENARFVTIYHDNMWTHPVAKAMRADIGWLCGARSIAPEGMRKLTLHEGHYIVSRPVERTDRNAAWSEMSGRYGCAEVMGGSCAYDEYDCVPVPFTGAKTQIFIRVNGASS